MPHYITISDDSLGMGTARALERQEAIPDIPEAELGQRAIILTPTGKDGLLITDALTAGGISVKMCETVPELLAAIDMGAAVVIVAQESLPEPELDKLRRCLAAQPAWSDLPLLILTFGGWSTRTSARQVKTLEALGNVTFLERPVRPETLRGATRAALRARARQYEMRARQDSLRQANSDLEQFAYSASHDLKEPLRNIALYSEILERDYARVLDPQGQKFLATIRGGAQRMDMLVHDLLAYVQVVGQSDDGAPLTETGQALSGALQNLSETISENQAQITWDPLPAARINEVHVQQILQNLIGNAIKYRSESRPRIHVSAARLSKAWRFSVADNGIGIELEYQERIFGIFKRLHSSTRYPGTGIGLAICQRIVERYRGSIWVESAMEKGSTFYFTVPD